MEVHCEICNNPFLRAPFNIEQKKFPSLPIKSIRCPTRFSSPHLSSASPLCLSVICHQRSLPCPYHPLNTLLFLSHLCLCFLYHISSRIYIFFMSSLSLRMMGYGVFLKITSFGTPACLMSCLKCDARENFMVSN